MDSECPVCLEPLIGTVVHMGCCKKMVHVQCYTVKCPMCRADLPVPIHAVQSHPSHIIVPVPVVYNGERNSKIARSIIGLIGVAGIMAIIVFPYYS
jgi:hypothetical protein